MISGRRAVVVTGASTGIGYAVAQYLSTRGIHVFGSVRTNADYNRLSQELGEENFTPLQFDVTDELAVRRAAEGVRLSLQGHRLLALINNAGFAMFAPATACSISDARKLMDTNFMGTLICTQAFLPLLGADRSLQGPPGRIIQMSSILAELNMPYNGIYTASKQALEGLTVSLRRELKQYGIAVVLIRPGSTRSDAFWKKLESGWSAYNGTDWEQPVKALHEVNLEGLTKTRTTPADVAKAVHTAVTARRPGLMYWVTYWEEWFMTKLLGSWLPGRWADFMWLKLFEAKATGKTA